MKAAASLLKCDPELVQKCKEMGCPAFKAGNRIAVEELREWIGANDEKLKASGDSLSLKEQKLNEEIRKLKISNDEKEKKLIAISQHQREISEMASEVQKRMYALPPRAPELAGLSVPDIEAKLMAWMDEVVTALGKQ